MFVCPNLHFSWKSYVFVPKPVLLCPKTQKPVFLGPKPTDFRKFPKNVFFGQNAPQKCQKGVLFAPKRTEANRGEPRREPRRTEANRGEPRRTRFLPNFENFEKMCVVRPCGPFFGKFAVGALSGPQKASPKRANKGPKRPLAPKRAKEALNGPKKGQRGPEWPQKGPQRP